MSKLFKPFAFIFKKKKSCLGINMIGLARARSKNNCAKPSVKGLKTVHFSVEQTNLLIITYAIIIKYT